MPDMTDQNIAALMVSNAVLREKLHTAVDLLRGMVDQHGDDGGSSAWLKRHDAEQKEFIEVKAKDRKCATE